ncbi:MULTISPECIES: hypothetical protein [unclassified Curtobacterium]|uniref:hypothetical protein n=1 Tax=unclassified Curtobacterium TaxID=257496 RepID=UPI0039B043D2
MAAETVFHIVFESPHETEEALSFRVQGPVAEPLIQRFRSRLNCFNTEAPGDVEAVREYLFVAARDDLVPNFSKVVRKTGHGNSSSNGHEHYEH